MNLLIPSPASSERAPGGNDCVRPMVPSLIVAFQKCSAPLSSLLDKPTSTHPLGLRSRAGHTKQVRGCQELGEWGTQRDYS